MLLSLGYYGRGRFGAMGLEMGMKGWEFWGDRGEGRTEEEDEEHEERKDKK